MGPSGCGKTTTLNLVAGLIERRVKRAAEILSTEHLLQRRPRQLSGGHQQRVALGRALVRDPKAFLMDEPLSNLDAKLWVQMRPELKRLRQELATTVIYVTHDQMEAMTMADRIAVMSGGLVQQLGSPEEIYERPANMFVAGFIGSPRQSQQHRRGGARSPPRPPAGPAGVGR